MPINKSRQESTSRTRIESRKEATRSSISRQEEPGTTNPRHKVQVEAILPSLQRRATSKRTTREAIKKPLREVKANEERRDQEQYLAAVSSSCCSFLSHAETPDYYFEPELG